MKNKCTFMCSLMCILWTPVLLQAEVSVAEVFGDHVDEGLTTRDGAAPDWFEVAGADKVFHPAKARIVGDRVQVTCDRVTTPAAVRFAWDNIAVPNLMNKNGLPASSFRTDRWLK